MSGDAKLSKLLPGFRAGALWAARLIMQYEPEHAKGYRKQLAQEIHVKLKEMEDGHASERDGLRQEG